MLFHLGVVDRPPRSGGPVLLEQRLAQVAAPIRAELVGYLDWKKATCHTKTVSSMATRLKHFYTGNLASDLALILGVSQSRMSKRRRGITPFDIDEASKTADYFGVSITTLFGELTSPKGGPDRGGLESARPDSNRRPRDSEPAISRRIPAVLI